MGRVSQQPSLLNPGEADGLCFLSHAFWSFLDTTPGRVIFNRIRGFEQMGMWEHAEKMLCREKANCTVYNCANREGVDMDFNRFQQTSKYEQMYLSSKTNLCPPLHPTPHSCSVPTLLLPWSPCVFHPRVKTDNCPGSFRVFNEVSNEVGFYILPLSYLASVLTLNVRI